MSHDFSILTTTLIVRDDVSYIISMRYRENIEK